MLDRDSFAIDTKKLSLLKSQNKTTLTTSSKRKMKKIGITEKLA